MNERIDKLLVKAGTTGVRQVWFTRPELEKFAELIVQECMEVVAKKCASPTAYNALAEHFGVEQ